MLSFPKPGPNNSCTKIEGSKILKFQIFLPWIGSHDFGVGGGTTHKITCAFKYDDIDILMADMFVRSGRHLDEDRKISAAWVS